MILLFGLGLLSVSCSLENTSMGSEEQRPEHFGFGRPASEREIDSLDSDVSPDGVGLPAGFGTVDKGQMIFQTKCERCHGKDGRDGPYGSLVSTVEKDTASNNEDRKEKTIGNYWPYATTIYDYVHRAMPYDKPGTLKPEEVYSLTAFLLYRNGIIDSLVVIDANSLPLVVMPSQSLFVPDDRADGPEVR